MVSATKDPKKVRAGHLGSHARWGPPRTARLDELDPTTRRIVTLILEADRRAREEAAEPDRVA